MNCFCFALLSLQRQAQPLDSFRLIGFIYILKILSFSFYSPGPEIDTGFPTQGWRYDQRWGDQAFKEAQATPTKKTTTKRSPDLTHFFEKGPAYEKKNEK